MELIRYINVKSSGHTEFIDITSDVQSVIEEFGNIDGVCYIYVPHTTAAVTINEGADPSVKRDLDVHLKKLVPHIGDYRHTEGNSDAHIKATIVGSSQIVLIESGKLQLGTWQAIYFCEFDGPRSRRVMLKCIEER